MSKSEQDALLAYFNTFKLARRVNTFASLADGKVLMEVMSQIDALHFKGAPARAGGAGPSENWVLKLNSMKRLYRLLLSCPLPPPQPSLSLTSLAEPNFSSVVRSPTSPDGLIGLIQIARFCLSIGVWANGNEKVIKKIQGLDEKVMAELMRSIEEVMGTLPEEEGEEGKRVSPIKVPVKDSVSRGSPPSLGGLREDRDRLSRDNEDLREKLNTLQNELVDLGSNLESTKQERDDALSRLTAAREASSTGLRSSQNASSEIDRLRADLEIAENNYHRAEAALEQESSIVQALTLEVEELRVEAEEATKMRDQLDEYRYTAERLQKTENVVEKYKKKLEESAGLRREFKKLEEENLALIESNSAFEAELKKTGSKGVAENTKSQLSALEKQVTEQTNEIIELQNQIEITRLQLAESTTAHERDKEELQLLQDRIQENELAGVKRNQSQSSLSLIGETSLEAELEDEEKGETKTDLKIKIRNLERQLGELQVSSDSQQSASTLNKMLEESNRARDRYQADYLAIRSEVLKLQAQLEYIRSGKGGDGGQTKAALRQEIEEITNTRDLLSTSNKEDKTRLRELEKDLSKALANLDLVGQDEMTQIERLRESVSVENTQLESRLKELEGELRDLREKDRLHLQETKTLLIEKIHLQERGAKGSEATAAPQDDIKISSLQLELQSTRAQLATLEKRYATESKLMLSAWQDLGSRTSRDHLIHALSNSTKRSGAKAVPQGWLGKQRRYQEDAVYARS